MTKIFKVPFADTGDKISPPDAVQADGSVSYTLGYGFDYQRDTSLDSGGAPIDPLAKVFPREQHNGILNDITTAIGEIQASGLPVWQVSGGPYPVNSLVRHSGKNWRSLVSNNSSIPSEGSSWSETSGKFVALGEGSQIQLRSGLVSGVQSVFARLASSELGYLWTSSNFDPYQKITGDFASTAGFINNEPSRPYIRNTSQAQNVLLATVESVNAKITGEYADQAGFINNDKSRPYLRHIDGTNVPLALLQSLNGLLPKRSFLGSDFIRIPDAPGGLIVQFGSVSVADDTVLAVSLPTAFPTAFISAFATPQSDAAVPGSNTISATAYRQNLSSVKIGVNATPWTPTVIVCWLAIGY